MIRRFTLILFVIASLAASSADAATHIAFLGQRFIPRQTTIDSFFGVGFDPVNRHLLSVNLTLLCDGIVTAAAHTDDKAITSDNGVAWDPVTEEFWFIGNDREVYRYVNDVKDVIFAIPETFEVPGVGEVTLDRPEGLAVDLNHVYVVDAGPSAERGEVAANEWFKFTRDGAPVDVSGSEFTAALQPHFDVGGDCVVDGLTWVPLDAPYAQGLFLMAVEHSGIQVLDADGAFVDRILWPDQGLVPGGVPFGFAGLTIDPLTGDLYLVENGGDLHIWERQTQTGATTHIYGVGGPMLHHPASPCGWSLLSNYGGTLGFSLTYRDVDGLLWTNDFSSGEVFTMDPIYPFPQLVGTMNLADVWGMAYDDERDVIYVFREPGRTLHALDPETLETTLIATVPFVRELAFNSVDKNIYGVGTDDGQAVLIRLDRDTGASTIVGPTVAASGITFDRLVGKLVGIADNRLYHIDPATGQAQIFANDVVGGWEGLAAVPIATPVSSTVATTIPPTISLRAFPNPLPQQGRIAFEMPHSGHVRAAVYDLAGRRVADLIDGTLGAGPQVLFWNSRDRRGRAVASGIYYVKVDMGRQQATTKVTVIR